MDLSKKIKSLPAGPGVYLMKSRAGAVIYVGKAKNLRSRVGSYFAGNDQSPKTKALVAEIADIDVILTNSEVEALLLERTLIRHNKPHYNVLLRDDKEYPFVKVNYNETWPRIEKVRRRKDDGATYVGPFGNASLLNTTLRAVFQIFPLIRCSRYSFSTMKRPCNYYHMKMCLGQCTKNVDRDEYVSIVRDAVSILVGQNDIVMSNLKEKMAKASDQELYEQAAMYRDQIEALRNIVQKQVAVVSGILNADAVWMSKNESFLSFYVTLIRNRTIVGGDSFLVPVPAQGDEDALISFLLQYYESRHLPDELIMKRTFEGIKDLLVAIDTEGGRKTKVIEAKDGEYREIMAHTRRNAMHLLKKSSEEDERIKVELEILRDTLKLDAVPRKIECIDISNLQDTAIVAAIVTFVDGRPAKDLYRHYNVSSLAGTHDDFKSMGEIVKRRIGRGIKEGDLPDLIIVDGGKGQLNAARKAIEEYEGITQPVVSIAKSRMDNSAGMEHDPVSKSEERVFIPSSDMPIILPEGSPVFRVITRIRDEAHRFAIAFHRIKRSREFFSLPLLDDIPGIGKVIKKRLLDRFSDIEGIKMASLDELMKVKGLSEKAAVALYSKIQSLRND
ncbi:MAG: excinuclease ABC subunit UvrC [Oligoflexales bacterium]|nr:excinuclease ABC subunit UvrC [Oligoflexales bacterium]